MKGRLHQDVAASVTECCSVAITVRLSVRRHVLHVKRAVHGVAHMGSVITRVRPYACHALNHALGSAVTGSVIERVVNPVIVIHVQSPVIRPCPVGTHARGSVVNHARQLVHDAT